MARADGLVGDGAVVGLGRLAGPDLHVHDVVSLLLLALLGVRALDEHQVARLHLRLRQLGRARLPLVRLVPPPDLEAKVGLEVLHAPPREPAAVEVQRRVLVRVALLGVVARRVRHVQVLARLRQELGPQRRLVLRGRPVDVGLRQHLLELALPLPLLAEVRELLLQRRRAFAAPATEPAAAAHERRVEPLVRREGLGLGLRQRRRLGRLGRRRRRRVGRGLRDRHGVRVEGGEGHVCVLGSVCVWCG